MATTISPPYGTSSFTKNPSLSQKRGSSDSTVPGSTLSPKRSSSTSSRGPVLSPKRGTEDIVGAIVFIPQIIIIS